MNKQDIANELENLIPTPPKGLKYSGVRIENGEWTDFTVRVDYPRWYRHPEEYVGDNNSNFDKIMKPIEIWEDKVWEIIEVMKNKYKVRIDTCK